MRAFTVYLNGKKLGTVGVGAYGVLSANITWVGREGQPTSRKRTADVEEMVGVALGGLDTKADEHLTWHQVALDVGDEVCIQVVEAAAVDRPRRRQKRNRTQDLRQQKMYVRRMAKKFGWKIVAAPASPDD